MAATPSPASCCSAACAVAGSPLSSTTIVLTGWPLMPPFALTQSAHAGATVPPWSHDEACVPDSVPITPTLIIAPFGIAALVVGLLFDVELLAQAARTSAVARMPASSVIVRLSAGVPISFASSAPRWWSRSTCSGCGGPRRGLRLRCSARMSAAERSGVPC